jgi:hypothetical protein
MAIKERKFTDENGNEITIRTDGKWKEILYYWDLPAKWKKEFDWVNEDDGNMFFKYRGEYYALGNFMRFEYRDKNLPSPFKGWDGYMSDSFFSGMLVKFDDSGDAVKVATYW